MNLKSKNGTPVLPSKSQYQDPTKQGARRHRAERDMNARVRKVKRGIKRIVKSLDKHKTANASHSSNSLLRIESMKQAGFVLNYSESFYFNKIRLDCGHEKLIKKDFDDINNIIKCNSLTTNRVYDYEITPSILALINREIENLLNDSYLDLMNSYNNSFWLDEFIKSAYLNGAQDAVDSAANVTAAEASFELTDALRATADSPQFKAAQLNRAALVGARSFEFMKNLTDQTKADLSATLFDGMRRGLGVTELTKNLVKRTNVSNSRAIRIVRTEINQAYRQATVSETEQLNSDVYKGSRYQLKMLWFSALASTTRRTHARRHGRTYTISEVESFYSKDGNAINCYCSQSQVLVDTKTGKVFQADLMKQMEGQKREFFKEDIEDLPPVSG